MMLFLESQSVEKSGLLCKSPSSCSHGQSTVERGFSYNKEVITDNLSQTALEARRVVLDHIRDGRGEVLEVNVDKKLMVSVGAAWGRYNRYLADQRKEKDTEERTMKRKRLADEIEDCTKKKKRADDDARQLVMEADRLSF